MQAIEPKEGDVYSGEVGTILSGARLLSSFSREGNYWVALGQTQQGEISGVCDNVSPRCSYPEDLFFDDVPLRHVATLSQVSSGRFFFDYTADKIYFADDPTGHKVEASVTPFAFNSTANNVTVQGMTIEKYATPSQRGAVGWWGDGTGWIIENNELRLNHGLGTHLGTQGIVRGNLIHNNGHLGLAAEGDRILIERNEISFNNYAGFDPGWEAGGAKMVLTTSLQVRCNYVHGNKGPGLWTDIDTMNTLYERNIVTNNSGAGIFHEISYDAVIRDNVVKGNGQTLYPWLWGAQILISTAQNVQVFNNVVEVASAGGNGIGIVHQDRTSEPGLYGTHKSANNFVYNNKITYLADVGTNRSWSGGSPAPAQSGAAADYDWANFWRSGNNQFNFNNYHAPSLSAYHWTWGDLDLNWSSFRSHGQDLNGTADTIVTPDNTFEAVPACQ